MISCLQRPICNPSINNCCPYPCLQNLILRYCHNIFIKYHEVRLFASGQRTQIILRKRRIRRVVRHSFQCLVSCKTLFGVPFFPLICKIMIRMLRGPTILPDHAGMCHQRQVWLRQRRNLEGGLPLQLESPNQVVGSLVGKPLLTLASASGAENKA